VLAVFLRQNDRTTPSTAAKATVEAAIVNVDVKNYDFAVMVDFGC